MDVTVSLDIGKPLLSGRVSFSAAITILLIIAFNRSEQMLVEATRKCNKQLTYHSSYSRAHAGNYEKFTDSKKLFK